MNNPTHKIEVSVTAAVHRDRLLCEAEVALLDAAVPGGNAGILITRHTLTEYSLTVSEEVPFGQTHIRDQWDRPAKVPGVNSEIRVVGPAH